MLYSGKLYADCTRVAEMFLCFCSKCLAWSVSFSTFSSKSISLYIPSLRHSDSMRALKRNSSAFGTSRRTVPNHGNDYRVHHAFFLFFVCNLTGNCSTCDSWAYAIICMPMMQLAITSTTRVSLHDRKGSKQRQRILCHSGFPFALLSICTSLYCHFERPVLLMVQLEQQRKPNQTFHWNTDICYTKRILWIWHLSISTKM